MRYLVRKLFSAIMMLFALTAVVFTLINLQPGNPYLGMINPNTPPELIHKLLTEMGYYEPLATRYFKWVCSAVQGDLGYSIGFKTPVVTLIGQRLPYTLALGLFAIGLSVMIAIPLAMWSEIKQTKWSGLLRETVFLVGTSVPTFLLSLLFIKVFSWDLGWFPISGAGREGDGFIDFLHHLFLPGTVLGISTVPLLLAHTANAYKEILKMDYMRTAFGKGISNLRVYVYHGLRNASIPIISILTLNFAYLFSGALITETIFMWPGIGRLNYEALMNRDYNLIMALLLLNGTIVIVSGFIGDILYFVSDPRMRRIKS